MKRIPTPLLWLAIALIGMADLGSGLALTYCIARPTPNEFNVPMLQTPYPL